MGNLKSFLILLSMKHDETDLNAFYCNQDMQYLFQQYYKDISAKYDTAAI